MFIETEYGEFVNLNNVFSIKIEPADEWRNVPDADVNEIFTVTAYSNVPPLDIAVEVNSILFRGNKPLCERYIAWLKGKLGTSRYKDDIRSVPVIAIDTEVQTEMLAEGLILEKLKEMSSPECQQVDIDLLWHSLESNYLTTEKVFHETLGKMADRGTLIVNEASRTVSLPKTED